MSTRATWSRQIHNLARASGWTVNHTRSGHYKLTHPAASGPVYAAGSPSDWRALRKVRADLRRRVAAVAIGEAPERGSV